MPSTSQPNLHQRISSTLVLGTWLAWPVLPFVDGWVTVVPLWLVIVVWQVYRRTRWAMVTLLGPAFVFVPMASFALGVLGYSTGTAVMRTVGKMSLHPTLDRQSRCYWVSHSCLASGYEPFTHAPNNFAIRCMTRWFGVMPGRYAGPYPCRAQAYEALALSTVVVGAVAFDGSTQRVDGTDVVLASALLDELREMGMESEEYSLCLFEGECLLVADESPAYEVFLVDLERENVFTVYTSPPAEAMDARLRELFRK